MEPIREEVEAAVAEHGWTKVALNRMRKLDSFMKETQRTQGLGGGRPHELNSHAVQCANVLH
jgi:hypothetical protein